MERLLTLFANLFGSAITCLRNLVLLVMAILLFLIGALGYGIYLVACRAYAVAGGVMAQPESLLPVIAAGLAIWAVKRFVLGRKLTILPETAVIIRTANGELRQLFRGQHRLKLGDSVCHAYSLLPQAHEANEEEARTIDSEPVRLGAIYEVAVIEPVRFHRSGGKLPLEMINNLNRYALVQVTRRINGDDFFNCPAEINLLIAQVINETLRGYGLRLTAYYLQLAVWPDERWQRVNSRVALQSGQYWRQSRGLERQRRYA